MNDSEVIDGYKSGNSIAQVAKLTGLTLGAVTKILNINGIKLRTRKEAAEKYAKFEICVICGIRFRVRDRWDSTANHYRKTCSPECESELRSKVSKEGWDDERKSHMSKLFTGRDMSGWNIPRGEQRSNWNGGHNPAYYRHLAFDIYGMKKKCAVEGCNEMEMKNLCVHHRDGNRNNNSRENLEIRCKRHHTGYHAKVGDCGWAVYNREGTKGVKDLK